MEVDPMEAVESKEEAEREAAKEVAKENEHRANTRLSARVAITVALLATFMGICKIKDENLGRSMERTENERLDHWNFYQARNIREEVADATLTELKLLGSSAPASQQSAYRDAIKTYTDLAADQNKKKEDLHKQADEDLEVYTGFNTREKQFDVSEAMIALAISLLAMTALTHKKWLYWLAMFPTAAGVLMGLAGFFAWHVYPSGIIRWLS